MALEKIKLNLLSHSKNMLNAAVSEEWQRFAELDSSWKKQLESAVSEYGEELDSIGDALLEDNQKIHTCIEAAQKALSLDLDKNMHSASAIKKYLK